MPANGFSIGGDLQMTIVDSQQGLQTFNIQTMADFRQLTARIGRGTGPLAPFDLAGLAHPYSSSRIFHFCGSW